MAIQNSDLTTSTIGGSGTIDILMTTMLTHLDDQWSKQRIKSPDYAKVYIQMLNTVTTSGVQFLLQRDKAEQEAALIAAQVLLAQANTAKVHAEIAKLQLESTKTTAEIALLEAKVISEEKQACILTIKCANEQERSDAEVALLVAQKDKAVKEVALITQTILKEQQAVLTEQAKVLLTQAQAALTSQKSTTESKQRDVMTAQIALYGKQADGFDHKAIQNGAKLMIDGYSVLASTQGMVNVGTGLETGNIHTAIVKMINDMNTI